MNTRVYLPIILGDSFRKAREAKGLTFKDLANQAVLSEKHIKQIENGQSDAFYTQAIKINSAKKVAKILGLTNEEAFQSEQKNIAVPILDETQNNEASALETKVSTEELKSASEIKASLMPFIQADTIQILEAKKKSEVKKESDPNFVREGYIANNIDSGLTTAQGGKDKPKAFPYPQFLAYLLCAVSLVFLIAQYNDHLRQKRMNAPAVPLPLAEVQNPHSNEPSKLIESVEMPKAVSLNSEIAVVKEVLNDVPKESSKLAAKVSLTIPECVALLSNPEKYIPSNASKVGNQVYVVGKISNTICFEDADGVQQKKDVTQNMGISFYGKPPFKLGSDNLDQFDIFYQGYRVKADLSKKSIILAEKDLN
jgi:transcriptional regulator with XRE-family HTH domain